MSIVHMTSVYRIIPVLNHNIYTCVCNIILQILMSAEPITHVLKLQTAATLMAAMSVCAGQGIIRCKATIAWVSGRCVLLITKFHIKCCLISEATINILVNKKFYELWKGI